MMEGTKECLIETGYERISNAYISCIKDVSEEDQEEVMYEESPGSDNGGDDVAQINERRTKVEDYLNGYHHGVTSNNNAEGELQQEECPQISKRRLFYDVCPQCTFEDEIISDTSSVLSQGSFHVASRTGGSQESQECQERSSSVDEVWSLYRKSSGSASSSIDGYFSSHASPSIKAHNRSAGRHTHRDTPSLGCTIDSGKAGSVIATKKSGFDARGEQLFKSPITLSKQRSQHQPSYTDDRNHGEESYYQPDCDSPCLAKVARDATRSSHLTVGTGRGKLRENQVEWYSENGKILLRDLAKPSTTTKRYIVDVNLRAWMSPVDRWGQYNFDVPIFQYLHPADFLVDFTFEYWMPSEKPRYDIDLSYLQSPWYDGPNQVGGKFDCSDDLLIRLTRRADFLFKEMDTLIADDPGMANEQEEIQVYSLTKVPSIDFHDTSIHEEVMKNGEPNDSAYVSAGGSQAPSEGSATGSIQATEATELGTDIDRQEPGTNHVDVTSIAYFTHAVACVNGLVEDQLVVSPTNTSEAATSEEEAWLPPSVTSNVDKAFSRAWLLDRQRRRRRGKEEKWRKQFISQKSDVKWFDIALALGAEDIESKGHDLGPSLGRWQNEWLKSILDVCLGLWYRVQAVIGAISGFIKRWSWVYIVFALVWLLVTNSLMKVLVSYGIVERPSELIINGHTYFLSPSLPKNATPTQDWLQTFLYPSTTVPAVRTESPKDRIPQLGYFQSLEKQKLKSPNIQGYHWSLRVRDGLDRALGWTGEEP